MSAQQPNKGKNVVVGCLVVLVIVVFGGAAVAYFLVGRPALAAINAARDLGRIQQLESQVRNRSSFTAPADGVLSESQVERYLAVSRQVMSDMEGRFAVLEERYQDVSADRISFGGFREAASAWAELLRLIVDAKQTQVSALNDTGFSSSEYDWVRRHVMEAAGVPLFQVDLAALLENDLDPTERTQAEPAPPANVQLVAPYREEIERLMPLAVFGL
jgi:hypothetical protein